MKVRYFLVSYTATGNIWGCTSFSCTCFPNIKEITYMAEVKDNALVVMNIYEFKSKEDFDSYSTKEIRFDNPAVEQRRRKEG